MFCCLKSGGCLLLVENDRSAMLRDCQRQQPHGTISVCCPSWRGLNLRVLYCCCGYLLVAVGSQALPATRSSMASSQCASIRLVPHNEPVKGLLSRYLNKKWLTARGGNSPPQDDMARVVEWLPSAWEHINTFLHSIVSPHAVLGKRKLRVTPVVP